MKPSRVTLKDIADCVGYSVNTVSRALRDDPMISENTRFEIQQAANKLKYIRNSAASSLRSGRSHIVAVVVNDLHNPHFCHLLSRMDAELRAGGYSMVNLCMHLDDTLATQLIQTAISLSVDGILYFPSTAHTTPIRLMESNGVPYVLVDREAGGESADMVRCDDRQGGYIAGRHLLSLGHRRFLYLSGVQQTSSQRDRLEGFIEALEEEGIPLSAVRIVDGELVEPAVAKGEIGELMEPVDYTAVVSFRDEIAYLVLNALHARHIRVPEDVSLISFDHICGENPTLPRVTSIYTAEKNIAAEAVRLLLQRMETPDTPHTKIVLPVQIFDEGTTAEAKTLTN